MKIAMKGTEKKAIAIVIVTTIFTSLGQVLWKMGSENLTFDVFALFTNYPLIFGWVCYGLGALLLVYAMKYGELTVLYPIIALSFIWVGFMSSIWLGEVMSVKKWLAIILILGGVSILGLGSQKIRRAK
jgi:undecaprenyl phosphate-alpha-L-ara4N flippase subunit ArnE